MRFSCRYSDDQGAFNRLITTGFYPVRKYSESGRVVGPVSGFGGQGLRVAPLPAPQFCSGHLVWVQQEGKLGRSVHETAGHARMDRLCVMHMVRTCSSLCNVCLSDVCRSTQLSPSTAMVASVGASWRLACGRCCLASTMRRVAS